MRKEFISVIIPAYNESGRILTTLGRIDEYLRSCFKNYEIIVVNDGSFDNTGDIVLGAGEKITSVKYIGYQPNRGKGYALRQGVAHSTGDIVLISDADLSTPIEELEKLLNFYESGADVIIGSRALAESQIVVRQPWWREFMGKTFNRFVKNLLLKDFQDTQCGFKLFRGHVAREIFSHSCIDRFAYDVEILYIAGKAGYKIKEVPIRWINSPDSRVRPLKDSFQTALDVLKIRFRKYR
ncbi:MAG: glycosyltransferase family 2 protein [Nitrospirae bacterium]|jgi:dolichyl-phosphate beta-glucosyltransferase|nr:glycosyltransferase family 2 protein [Nitrospirota bacterium]